MYTARNVKSFKRAGFVNKDLMTLQDNVQNFSQQLVDLELLSYSFLRSINLVSGQNNIINHLLMRELLGVIVVRQSAQSDIWDNQAVNNRPDLTLYLNCSVNCTVSLIVF